MLLDQGVTEGAASLILFMRLLMLSSCVLYLGFQGECQFPHVWALSHVCWCKTLFSGPKSNYLRGNLVKVIEWNQLDQQEGNCGLRIHLKTCSVTSVISLLISKTCCHLRTSADISFFYWSEGTCHKGQHPSFLYSLINLRVIVSSSLILSIWINIA